MDKLDEELVVAAVAALERVDSSETARAQVRAYLVRRGWTPPAHAAGLLPYPSDHRVEHLTQSGR